MEAWQNTGAALEMFEECLRDIDSWVQYGIDGGYRRQTVRGFTEHP